MIRARHLALLSLLVVAAAVAACDDITGPAPSISSTPPASGIRGSVLVAPTCPDPTLASPCVAPYAAQLVIVDGSGQTVARVTSRADGRFEVSLAPGEYTINPVPVDPYPAAPPQSASVVAGAFTQVEVDYDSGRLTVQSPLPYETSSPDGSSPSSPGPVSPGTASPTPAGT